MKKILSILIITFLITSCSSSDDTPQYSINLTDVFIEIGESQTINPTISPQKIVTDFIYNSSNPLIFSVDSKGVIKGVSEGNATLNISSEILNTSTSMKVTVSAIKAESISLSKTTLLIEKGESDTITASILPQNTTNKEVIWTSSDETIATVNNGIVTSVSVGNCIITSSIDGKDATCIVTVEPIKITSISLTATTYEVYTVNDLKYLDLVVGDTDKLTSTITPNNVENKGVRWTSSDPNVVSINDEGNIVSLAHSDSPVTITITTDDGNKKDYLHINSKTINYYINVITGTNAMTLNNNYLTGFMYSTINNRSTKQIILVGFSAIFNDTNLVRVSNPLNNVLNPNQTTEEVGFNVENEYKPDYRFTWTFTYDNETYSISKNSNPRFN